MLVQDFGFWIWRLTLACGVLFLLSAEYSSYVQGLSGNLDDLTGSLSWYIILLGSETSNIRHMWEFLVTVFGCAFLLCGCRMPWGQWMVAYVFDVYEAFHQSKFDRGCCEMLVFSICGVRQNLCVQSLLQP